MKLESESIAVQKRIRHKKITMIFILAVLTAATAVLCLFTGSSGMSVRDGMDALAHRGSPVNIRILWNIRVPRIMAALTAGAGLSVSGLIMQAVLNNPMASPATLGVSNAAVFGANLSIIAFAGGFLSTGHNVSNYTAGVNPYASSLIAFLFSILSVLIVVELCRVRSFSPNVVVLAGIAMGSVWNAGTTILQFYATDVGSSAAVIWTFGDLGRATYRTDWIMLAAAALGIFYFQRMSWRYNALQSGDAAAMSMGINVELLRGISMLLASLITAVCVSFLGIIGFIGIICPHSVKKLMGQDFRFSTPASALAGSLLLLLADTLSRSMGGGSALPVGAITTLLGAPFFIIIIFSERKGSCGC